MRLEVGKQVWEEIVRLQLMAYAESATTRQVFQRQETKARALLAQVTAEAAASQLRVAAPLFEFYDEIPVAQQKACGLSSSMQKAELLLRVQPQACSISMICSIRNRVQKWVCYVIVILK